MSKQITKPKKAIFPPVEKEPEDKKHSDLRLKPDERPFTTGDFVMNDRGGIYKIGKCTLKGFETLHEDDDGNWELRSSYTWADLKKGSYGPGLIKMEKSLEEYKAEAIHHLQTNFKDLEKSKEMSDSTDLVTTSDKTHAKTLKNGLINQQNHIRIVRRTLELMQSQMNVILSDLQEKITQVSRVVDVIELYLGVKEKVVQIQEGEAAPPDEPITFRQLVLHMDEETADEDMDWEKVETFDQFMREHTDQIFPEKKGVVVCRPRAADKDYDPDNEIMNSFLNESNRDTYILIRNGDNLYRIWTSVRIYPYLFPSQDELRKLMSQASEDNWGFSKRDAENTMHQYKRNVLVLQGLMDRTSILHPIPPGVTLFKPDSYGKSIRFIYDGSNLLPSGKISWSDYRLQCNQKTQRGDRVYLAKVPYGEFGEYDMWRSPMHDKGYRGHENGPPKPPSGVYNISEIRVRTKRSYSEQESEERIFLISYKDKDERYDYRRGNYVSRRNRTPFWLTEGDKFFINYEHVSLEEIEFYLNDRVNRRNYLRMMPVLRGMKKSRLEELEWEKAFVRLLQSKIKQPHSEKLIWEGIEWWKRRVIDKRPLRKEDAKAVRMITKYVEAKIQGKTYLEPKKKEA